MGGQQDKYKILAGVYAAMSPPQPLLPPTAMSPPQPLLPPAAMSPPQPLLPPAALVVVLGAVAEPCDVVVCWFALVLKLANWSRAKARMFSTMEKD